MNKRKKRVTKKPVKDEVPNKKRKAPTKKKGKKNNSIPSARRGKGKSANSRGKNKSKRTVSKVRVLGKDKSKTNKKRKSLAGNSGKNKQVRNKRAEKPLFRTEEKKGSNVVKIHISGRSKPDKKIKSLENDFSTKIFDKYFRRKKGRGPKGIIATVESKDGKSAGKINPVDFVFNKENVKKFAVDFLKELSENYNPDFADSGETTEGYKDYDPSTISGLNIVFIY